MAVNSYREKYGVSQLICRFHCLVFCDEQSLRPGNNWDTGCHSDLTSAMLQPERFNGFGPRAYKNHPGIGDSLGKFHILRQESIARNNCIDLIGTGDFDY